MEALSIGVIITSLLSVMKIWTKYDIEKRKVASEGKPEPEKPAEADKGKKVAEVVEAGIETHGNDDEKEDLKGFQRNPERYAEMMQRVLSELAKREPAFAQQLRELAKEHKVKQSGGVHGEANIGGNSYGQTAGVSTGTMTQTQYAPPPREDEKKDT